MTITLVLGGARSGKSRHAESVAAKTGKEVVYIATAQAGDEEMRARILLHRRRRPDAWITVETPLALADAIQKWSSPTRVVLVDCLTVWLSNLLFSDGRVYPEIGTLDLPLRLHAERAALLEVLSHPQGDLIMVANEVGLSIVPMGAISRAFVDQAGWLNQEIAARCDHAVLTVAGLPLVLKGAAC
ncbi:bifunctional adenosylcobinamide kinase/adenosylcobinamide-phosphate guanylyltransferase [Pigmentiphaga aceris]|uniref:Bifunctional adenosylcobalamin biosynthesis protein n=1 Tax=Pigmentiphaga aceris TaxID=1940612 RepID=A0A5C0B7B3_9BURK|nr:bifunctional adenosylcobinamide kinase/adenosylcobinamide-phosphate guanylyltransferase [Pigmentiphaga aceris]QEI08971.1 bifunctional adenosylcobinamide kinase/adenosylcobinamide-phosphate guanylyltransferase [Pigmentiphaga aceris]